MSTELLQLITRNRSAFVNVNLKRQFTNDPYSGTLTVRKTDPGFLAKFSTGACLKNGKLCLCKKTAQQKKNKNKTKSICKLTKTCELLDKPKGTVSNRHVGRKFNKIQSLLATQLRTERAKKIRK